MASEKISKGRVRLANEARALSTRKKYESMQKRFKEYAKGQGFSWDDVNEELPERICDFIEVVTHGFTLKPKTSELVRKSLGALYESLGRSGEWRIARAVGSGTVIVEGNPAKCKKISKLISDHYKCLGREGAGEVSADPLTYEHWIGIYEHFLGTPPANVAEDFGKARELRCYAMTLLGASLLLRFDEISRILFENIEIFDLSRVYIYLPCGSKNRQNRLVLTLEEWPTCLDIRVSPLAALARWLRLRGDGKGPLFCAIGSDGLIQTRNKCNPQSLVRDLRSMLERVGVTNMQYITTHSMRRGGAQFYSKQGMKHEWIMKKGNWSDYAAFQRYLMLNNRDSELAFESAMARDIHESLTRVRKLERFIYHMRSALENPLRSHVTGEDFRAALFALFNSYLDI